MRLCRVTVVGLWLTFCCIFCQAKDLWKDPSAWQQLDKKMTELQVTGLLGEPLDKETIDPFEVWYYHEAPQRTDGRITWRPKTGFVRFKKMPLDGQEISLLLDWKVPLWRDVPMPVAEVNLPAAPITPIASAEPEKKEPAKTEVNLPQPPQPAAPPQPETKPETSWQNMPTAVVNWFKSIPHIWLWIGGGVAAFIIFAILKPDPRYRAPKKKKNDNTR